MKRQLLYIFLACLFINSTAMPKKKGKAKKIPKSYFITNWSDYGMPSEIEADKLRQILETIAYFKRLEYCPFEEKKKCQRGPINGVVKEVIEQAFTEKPQNIADDGAEETTTTIKPSDSTHKSDTNSNDQVTEQTETATTEAPNTDEGGDAPETDGETGAEANEETAGETEDYNPEEVLRSNKNDMTFKDNYTPSNNPPKSILLVLKIDKYMLLKRDDMSNGHNDVHQVNTLFNDMLKRVLDTVTSN